MRSPEERERISRSVKLWWTGPRRRRQARLVHQYWVLHPERLNVGPRSPEAIAKQAESLRRRWADPAFRVMMAAATRRGWTTKARRKFALLKLGHTLPAEIRERMRKSALERWARRRGVSDTAPRGPGTQNTLCKGVVDHAEAGQGGEA